MPYASWPYDEPTRSETNTLRGRLGMAHGHESSYDRYHPAPQYERQEATAAPDPYRSTLSGVVRAARDRT